MRTFKLVSGGALAALTLIFSLAGPTSALAATTPSLGMAATYAVLSSTYTNTTAGTTISGDIGFTTPPAVTPGGTHAHYGSGAPYSTAGSDQGIALSALATEPCTFTFAAGAIDLATDTTHPGSIGVYPPGVYCTGATSAASIGTAGITLSGAGTYIFRINGALTSVSNSVVTLSGASACDVFWTPTGATTLADNSTFVGTDIDASGITIGTNVNWSGRALAFGGTVKTVLDDTITTPPACSIAPTTSGSHAPGTITVIKKVINDNGGTKTVADFPLFVNGSPVASGVTNAFPYDPNPYIITETGNSNYTQSFSGDCDTSGHMLLGSGDMSVCIITNNDIGAPVAVPPVPPLIDVVKVPSPLALPAGPGNVTYTYTVRNIGTVPMTNVTMVGDTCSPITLTSGDVNGDSKLDVTETWVYNCSTNLAATHTNTVVATGWANGLSAVDLASATVVVGVPVIPPLIHVTKVPSPLTLPAGGGLVTFTEKITNPGTVALSNVSLTDDKCSPMQFVSGDLNGDGKLDPSETWTYTCQSRLAATTSNTATAVGEANGLTVRDFAIATVVVAAAPLLPKTGLAPANYFLAGGLVAAGILALALLAYAIRKKQTA